MGKGKVIGAVAAAVAVPAAVIVGAIYILPALGISSSNTLYYFGNDSSVAADGTISLGKEEVLGYNSKYSDTMTGYFKAQLDENETYIYNAFMYASENGYSDIFLPEDVFDNGSYDRLQELEYVITFLSCDSPFVAHNYTTNSKLTGNVEQFAGKSYHHIQLETLGEEYKARREAAYEKAKSVVASIPSDCDTDKQKAQYLYNYVAENSVYVTDGYSTRNVPIADLLIDGKAICDGYADTVTMLFNMAGIETASANGVNTEKNTVLFRQSDVPEVCELTWILNNVTPVGLLERAHSYKDKIAKGFAPNNGLFSYPVLMASDILLYQSNLVPVGKDQKQHLEITRDIAIKFNNQYGDVFTIPEELIPEEVAIVPGTDGQKMSKS